jgi:hypothetical protein
MNSRRFATVMRLHKPAIPIRFQSISCPKALHFLLAILFYLPTIAQDTLSVKTYRSGRIDTIVAQPASGDSLYIPETAFYKKRQRLVTYSSIGIYATALIGLNSVWYADYPRQSFHFFDDNQEWKQMDKVGHGWSTYGLSRLTYGAWRWAGTSEKKAVLLASISGPGFLTVIETLDGFSSNWGWSWGDMAANVFGGGLFAAQQLGWHEQRISYKFSFHRKAYGETMLTRRAGNLYGSSLAERALKDYNGQSYWLSVNLQSFLSKSKLPRWLNIAVGYGAEGMFGGTENIAKEPDGTITFSRTDIPRYRQWYLSPDVDFTRIKTKSKFLKTAFYFLNGFKFPAPSLELSQGKLKLKGIVF